MRLAAVSSPSRCLLFFAGFACFALGPQLHAQWDVAVRPASTSTATFNEAVITGKTGHRLHIFRDGRDQVFGEFELREGLLSLSSDGCPTYKVDGGKPIATSSEKARCETDGRRSRFRFGQIAGQQVRSAKLLEIMNGSRMELIYRLKGLGYDSAKFSLSGSKQAINEVLGNKITVVGE